MTTRKMTTLRRTPIWPAESWPPPATAIESLDLETHFPSSLVTSLPVLPLDVSSSSIGATCSLHTSLACSRPSCSPFPAPARPHHQPSSAQSEHVWRGQARTKHNEAHDASASSRPHGSDTARASRRRRKQDGAELEGTGRAGFLISSGPVPVPVRADVCMVSSSFFSFTLNTLLSSPFPSFPLLSLSVSISVVAARL